MPESTSAPTGLDSICEGSGDTASSMTVRVWKIREGGRRELISARVVGPREELTRATGTEYPTCTCPRCRANAAAAAS